MEVKQLLIARWLEKARKTTTEYLVYFQTFYFYYSHSKNDKVFIFSPAL